MQGRCFRPCCLLVTIMIIVTCQRWSHCYHGGVVARVCRVHLMNADSAPCLTASWLGPFICYCPHPPSPFMVINHSQSWYTSYHITEGGRSLQFTEGFNFTNKVLFFNFHSVNCSGLVHRSRSSVSPSLFWTWRHCYMTVCGEVLSWNDALQSNMLLVDHCSLYAGLCSHLWVLW